MGFPRQEYWSWLPFPPPGDLPYLKIKHASPGLAGKFVTTEPPGKPSDQIKLTQLIQDVARFLVSSPLLDKETYTGPGGLVCG